MPNGEQKPFQFKATIYGHLQSKSNSRKLVSFGGRPAFIKSQGAREWLKGALIQGKTWHIKQAYEGVVDLTAIVYYPDRRNDLDVSLLADFLQVGSPKNPGIGLIKNDRLIEQFHLYRKIDKTTPRVDFVLTSISDVDSNKVL